MSILGISQGNVVFNQIAPLAALLLIAIATAVGIKRGGETEQTVS